MFIRQKKGIMESEIKDKRQEASKIIRNHIVWSMGAGAVPIPVADFFAVSAVQMDMIRRLANIYEVDFSEKEGKALISSVTSAGLARLGAKLVKFIPGAGTIVGAVTLSILSGASTYALGNLFKEHFETGGTILDFDPKRVKDKYDDLFEKGKEYVKQVKKDKPFDGSLIEDIKEDKIESIKIEEEESISVDQTLSKIKELMELKAQGAITDEEYEILKKRIVAG